VGGVKGGRGVKHGGDRQPFFAETIGMVDVQKEGVSWKDRKRGYAQSARIREINRSKAKHGGKTRRAGRV